jgi:hypothetical protein
MHTQIAPVAISVASAASVVSRASTRHVRSLLRGVFAACALSVMAAHAAKPAPSAAQERYDQERAKCMNGSSNQDKATCLKEAGAARDEARKGQLDDGAAKYDKNARGRCDALSGDEAKDCRARMKGAGTVSGSAQSGGILRESVTRTTTVGPAVTLPAVPAASAP